jgi:hypothetical protein
MGWLSLALGTTPWRPLPCYPALLTHHAMAATVLLPCPAYAPHLAPLTSLLPLDFCPGELQQPEELEDAVTFLGDTIPTGDNSYEDGSDSRLNLSPFL